MRFTYKGVGKDGRPVSGEAAAQSAVEAAEKLAAQGVQATELKPVRQPEGLLSQGVSAADIATFCEQLASLTDTQQPLPEALAALARDARAPALRAALGRVAAGLDAGGDLADLLEGERRIFPPLLTTLVRAGQATGNLSETLRLTATHTWQMAALRQKVWAALSYPLVVLTLLALVGSGALMFVTPYMRDMLAELEVEQPLGTRVVLAVGAHYPVIAVAILAFVVAVIAAFRLADRTRSSLAVKRWIMFNVPVLGRVLKATYLARFCRSMSLLLATETPLDTAVELLGHLDAPTVSQGGYNTMAESLRNGASLADAMSLRLHMFPELLTWIVRSCEATGRLPEAFDEAADMYQHETERNIEVMNALLPAVLVIVVGGLIGFTILALFAPLIHLMGALQ